MGTGTEILLYVDDTNVFTVRPVSPAANDTVVCKSYDLGAPSAKDSIEERVGRNGVNDNTTLHGQSVARFELQLFSIGLTSHWDELERLKTFLDPTKRYYVQYRRTTDGVAWRAIYRPDPWSLTVDKTGGNRLVVSVQLNLPDGCYETDPVGYELRPQGLAVGFSAPFEAPFSLTPSSGTGAAAIVVGGTQPVPFKAFIYGGQTGPVIMDTDTGRKLSFTAGAGLDIPLGSYVEVDTEKGTALLNGDINNSVYQYIDFAISQWWALRGGESNRISTSATTSDGSAQTIIYVASRRL